MNENSKIKYTDMTIGRTNNLNSARVISTILCDAINPKSVIDFGCATGIWLNQFRLRGCDIQGVDGEWVLNEKLFIPEENIEIYDFENKDKDIQCIQNKHYDLAICLEMAEHVSEERANYIIDSLTKAADVVYFSGATPFSGGIHHVNEHWQIYWINKFKSRGFDVIDYIRPKTWNDDRVCYFYSEESFVFVKRSKLTLYPMFSTYIQEPIFDAVHPIHFTEQIIKPTHEWSYLRGILSKVIKSMWIKLWSK